MNFDRIDVIGASSDARRQTLIEVFAADDKFGPQLDLLDFRPCRLTDQVPSLPDVRDHEARDGIRSWAEVLIEEVVEVIDAAERADTFRHGRVPRQGGAPAEYEDALVRELAQVAAVAQRWITAIQLRRVVGR